MKTLLRGALALACALAITAPAFAQHATSSAAPAGYAPEQTCLTWSGGAIGVGSLVPCSSGAGGGGGGGGDASAANQSSQITLETAIRDRIGDAVASPASNTIGDRLKTIGTLLASPLSVTGTFWQATQPVSAAAPITVGGSTVIVGGSITRPADTLVYAVGDLIGSSTSANCSTGCSVGFVAARNTTGSGFGIGGSVVGVRVSKGDTVAAVTIRVHFWKTAPTATVGDNGVQAADINYIGAVHICYVDVLLDLVGSDGAKGSAAPPRSVCSFSTASGGQLFFTLEARTAWTPTSAEAITVAAEVYQD